MKLRLFKCCIVALFLALWIGSTHAQTAVFFVRHAEKNPGGAKDDPDLSRAGQERAKALAKTLEHAEITAIYVSDRKRTQQTAQPLAEKIKIAPAVLSKAETESLPERLKTAGGNVLIVGHSNTIPELIGALGIPNVVIGDNDYDNLFLVLLGERPRLIRMRYR